MEIPSTAISPHYTDFHSLRKGKITVPFQMLPKTFEINISIPEEQCPQPESYPVSSDIVAKQPSRLRLRLLHTNSLPQHSLSHHHVKDPHWKIWPEIIAETIPGTIPPPPPCICTASAKPNLNSECCKSPPKSSVTRPQSRSQNI